MTQYETDVINGYKICVSCNIKKDLKDFSFEKPRYRAQCRRCRLDRIKSPLKIFKIDDTLSKRCGLCDIIQPLTEFGKQEGRTCKSNCHKCSKIRRRNQHIKNREWDNARNKQYAIKNKDRLKIIHREYQRNRRKDDIEYRIKCILVSTIGTIIRSNNKNAKKAARTFNLIGCSLEDFLKYIESKFLPGMSMDKIGHGHNKVNIDHIIPCETFDFMDEKQQKACFHYTNLQPLWYQDNVKKSDSLPNGRRARDLSPQEKLDYLRSLGFDV
jgi:hypothetical protein